MEAPGNGSNFLGEAGFCHHMDIFKRQIFRHAISGIVQCDGIESIDDRLRIGRRQDAGCTKHGCMGL